MLFLPRSPGFLPMLLAADAERAHASIPRSDSAGGLHPSVADALQNLHVRPLTRPPENVIEGPFWAKCTVTDNSTTAHDLTTIATWQHSGILDAYSANDPELMMQIDAVEAYLVMNAETESALANLLAELRLHWKTGKDDYYLDLIEFGGTFFDQYNVSTTETNVTKLVYGRTPRRAVLQDPWYPDLHSDTLELAPRNAVNMGANVTVYLKFHGVAHPSNLGRRVRENACAGTDLANREKAIATYRTQRNLIDPEPRFFR